MQLSEVFKNAGSVMKGTFQFLGVGASALTAAATTMTAVSAFITACAISIPALPTALACGAAAGVCATVDGIRKNNEKTTQAAPTIIIQAAAIDPKTISVVEKTADNKELIALPVIEPRSVVPQPA